MAKSIKFTASGSCSALGNFAPGDQARNIPDDLANHLVNEAMCAQYLTPPGQQPAAPAATPAADIAAMQPAAQATMPAQPAKKPKAAKQKGPAA